MTTHASRRIAVACVAAFALMGCGSTPPHATRLDASPTAAPTAGSVRDVIGTAELRQLRGVSALDGLVRLRPHWIGGASNAGSASRLPVLYVDGLRQGDVTMLADISVEAVREMRYYRPNEAKTRFGRWDDGGVVVIWTLR